MLSRLRRSLALLLLILVGVGVQAPASRAEMPPEQAKWLELYDKTHPVTVYIVALIDEAEAQLGAGVLVNNEGLVLTRRSVVWDTRLKRPANRIMVYYSRAPHTPAHLPDHANMSDAVIEKMNEAQDLALIRVKSVDLARKAPARAAAVNGQLGVVISFPPRERFTLSAGSLDLSGKAAAFNGALVAATPGAPFFDVEGRLIGLLSAPLGEMPSAQVTLLASEEAWLRGAGCAALSTTPAPEASWLRPGEVRNQASFDQLRTFSEKKPASAKTPSP